MCRLHVNIFQFFVAVDYDTKDDRLWYEKYSIRKPMLPSFISMELGTKVSIAMYIKMMCTCIRAKWLIRPALISSVCSMKQLHVGVFLLLPPALI